MKILVIDDEELLLNLTRRILEKGDHQITMATDGSSGLATFAATPQEFAIVIVDQTMPGMTGTETIEKIREISPTQPCVLSSGHALRVEDLPEHLRAHTYLLQKPYRAWALMALVDEILKAETSG